MVNKRLGCFFLATYLMVSSLNVVAAPETVSLIGQDLYEENVQVGEETLDKAGEPVTVGDFVLNKNGSDESYTLSSYTGSSETVDMTTGEIADYKITDIGQKAFMRKAELKKVILQDSVQRIAYGAFLGSEALEECELPSSLVSIGEDAFRFTSVKEVTIPATCSAIEEGAFRQSAVEMVTFEERTEDMYLGESVFYECKKLSALELPNPITKIPDYFCWSCTALTEVKLPDNCESIGDGAFYETAIVTITIPEKVTVLPGVDIYDEMHTNYGAFGQCEKLETVIFAAEQGLISIGSNSFVACRSLSNIQIPETVEEIGPSAFAACESLTSVKIPDGVTCIQAFAFEQCVSLNEIVLSKNCESISEDAFWYCRNLSEVTIPASCNVVSKRAFSGCDKLSKVLFLNADTAVASDAFTGISKDQIVLVGLKGEGKVCDFAKSLGYKYQRLSESISIVSEPIKTKYFRYQSLDLEGITVSANFISEEGTEWGYVDIDSCLVSGYDETQLGEHTITVKYGGVQDTFKVAVVYNILDTNISSQNVVYTGEAANVSFDVICKKTGNKLVEGVDYTVLYIGDNVSAGMKKAKIIGIGAYGGETYVDYFILEAETDDTTDDENDNTNNKISVSDLTIHVSDIEYTGGLCKPSVVVEYDGVLLDSSDYTISYHDNTNVGTGYVTIYGRNNYEGNISVPFRITPKSLKTAVVTFNQNVYAYDGYAKTPVASVILDGKVLTEGVDYSVTYSNNIYAGLATVTVTGKGNYSGNISAQFSIEVLPGIVHEVGTNKYKVVDNTQVAFVGVAKKTIKKVSIPATVTIGGNKYKVTSIADKALKGAKVTKVTVGSNVTKIGKEAFSNTKKLKQIVIKSTKLKSVGKNALKGINGKAKIKVPKKKLSSYKKLFKKKGQGKNVKISK